LTDSNRIDPERLAALLDGRLSKADAADVRSQLASADEDTLAAYADAAAIAHELSGNAEPAVAPGAVTPLVAGRARSIRRRWFIPAAAAAAAILGYVAWPRDSYAPARFVAELSNTTRAAEGPVWSATRGTEDRHAENVIAVRAGALLTDLQLAATRHEPTAEKMRALLSLVANTTAGRSIVAAYGTLADSSVVSTAQLVPIGRDMMALFDERLCTVGAYLEAARIAAASGDTLFFDRIRAEPVLSVLRRDQSLDPAARGALQALDSLGRPGAHNAPAVLNATRELLRALTQ
jgi:hypothetical protein